MKMLVKLAAAALLVSSATLVLAQSESKPGPGDATKNPTEPKDAAPAAGGAPPAKSSTSNAENDKKDVTPKKLEEQGKSGNR
jgi:hypothetical protein